MPSGRNVGSIVFAPGIAEADDSAVDPLDTFPAGMTIVYATFDYSGLTDGTPYRSEWLLDGQVQPDLTSSETWQGGDSGNWWFSIYAAKGVRSGQWTFNFYLDDQLASTGKMTVEAAPASQANFTPIVFAGDKDANDQPVNPATADNPKLAQGVTKLYAFYNGVNMVKGSSYTTQWFYNGSAFTDKSTFTWNIGPNDADYVDTFHTDNSPLDPGTYELRIWIGSRLVKLAAVIISSK